MTCEWHDKIFSLAPGEFEKAALGIFQFQIRNNPVYSRYLSALGVEATSIRTTGAIPFLPISFFKTASVKSGLSEPAAVFESSGTSRTINSRHLVTDLEIYKKSFLECFRIFYGDPREWCILALLPSYLERKNSSLVFMMDHLINRSGHPAGGFYLYDYDKLKGTLLELEKSQQQSMLFGVSFALLEFAERFPIPLANTIIVETGGMKGRKKELTRDQLHEKLRTAFGVPAIHSEYGMTELLSQAYSTGYGRYRCPPWMRIMIRDEEDPFGIKEFQGVRPVSGAINVIDLANMYSCSFIATEDSGKLYPDGSFEVLGRLDGTDLRGCSLMIE